MSSINYDGNFVAQQVEYCCVNCSNPGTVAEIHIYNATNVFERSVTILDALVEVFSTPILQAAQDGKLLLTMCTPCAEALSHIYQAFINLLSLSNAASYLTKAVAQIEHWHFLRNHSTIQDQTFAIISLGINEEGSHAFQVECSGENILTLRTAEVPLEISVSQSLTKELQPLLVLESPSPSKINVNEGFHETSAENSVIDPSDFDVLPVDKPRTTKGKYVCRNIQSRRYFKCHLCPAQFIPIFELHEHILTVHEGKPRLKCVKCPFTYLEEIIKYETHVCIDARDRKGSKKTRPFVCDICGARFGGSRLLTFHVERVHTQESIRYKCHYPDCRKTVVDRHKLFLHMEIHTESKSYLCFDCGKGFSQKRGLDKHLEIHFIESKIRSEQRQAKECGTFPCDICHRVFSYKRNLQQHLTMHSEGENKYKCPVCAKPHWTKKRLEKHIPSHDPPKDDGTRKRNKKSESLLQCASNKDLETHLEIKDEEFSDVDETLSCHVCGQSCSNQRNLDFHLRKHMTLEEKLASLNKSERNHGYRIKEERDDSVGAGPGRPKRKIRDLTFTNDLSLKRKSGTRKVARKIKH